MKTKPNILLEEIADDFVQYLMSGYINLTSFTKEIDPNLNIDNIEKLLRIHFVLTKGHEEESMGVIDFIEKLSKRLRRIKTTIKKEKEFLNCEVRGKINWKYTLINRCNQNPKDKTLFVCERQEKNYNVDENLVLKKLLQIIYNIIYNDLKVALEKEYSWLKDWIKEKKLRNILNELFLRNIYLKRIDLTNVKVTDRMISRTLRSRSPLYREAAILLQKYRKLMNYDLDAREAKELLKNTFINPKKDEVLFELYWIIKIIRANFKNPHFRLIEPDKNIVAEWESGNHAYKIYHNSCGSFKFEEKIRDLDEKLKNKDNYLGRELKVIEKLEKMAKKHLQDTLWGGRPDIILEKYNKNGEIVSVVIGEVKYTDDKNYAVQGLKELLEYMALIKEEKEEYNYVEDYNNLFKNLEKVRGYLFLDNIIGLDIEEESNIQVIMFGKDPDKLKEIL